jgi:DNA-binding XRE family transcriptional regulator
LNDANGIKLYQWRQACYYRRVDGDELKAFRAKVEITQQELAEALGVDRNTIARWERNERAIPPFLHLALQTLERQKKSSKK